MANIDRYNSEFFGTQVDNATDAVVNALEDSLGTGASKTLQTGKFKVPLIDTNTELTSGDILTVDENGMVVADENVKTSITSLQGDVTTLSTNKADKANTYTKTETDALLNNKASKATTLAGYNINNAYTKNEVDNLISHAGGSELTAGNTFIMSITPLLSKYGSIYVTVGDLKNWFNEWFDEGADIQLPFSPDAGVGLKVPFIPLITVHYHTRNNFKVYKDGEPVAGYNENKFGFLYKGRTGSSGQEVSSYSLAAIWVKENGGEVDYNDIIVEHEDATISYRGDSFKEMLNLLTEESEFHLFPTASSNTGPFPSGLVSFYIIYDSFVVPYNYLAEKCFEWEAYHDNSANGAEVTNNAISDLFDID